jgi:long-subunit fatty acid transport protein
MTLKNNTKVDDLGLFPDGEESASDVPSILGIGIGYKGLNRLEAQVSYTYFFNKNVDWGMNVRDLSSWKSVDPTKIRHREIDKNGYEVGLGLQFNITDNFSVSVGGLYGDMGVAPSYQSDFSYSNPSATIGGGIMWKITDKLTLDAGVSDTFYQDQTVPFEDPNVPSYNDILGKTTVSFAAGISYSIF